jgi:NAD(P)-dependent dehydrogenase (short-subunit alcohol dehydrogenase family)
MNPYLNELFNIEGKVAVLTGAGGYLIGELSRAFAKAGVKVVVADLREDDAERVAGEIRSNGGTAIPYVLDVHEKKQFEETLEHATREYGRVDILVNGAGINAPTPFLDIPAEEWDDVLAVQLRGTMFGCQVFGRYMVDQGRGCILNISSASADPPLSKAFTYSVAKAGIKNLTQNLAREWGTKGVRVNALRPGFFPTEWSKKNFLSQERIDAIHNHTAMKRFGHPSELVGAVLWLCSDAAGFVTGAEIAVDGGFSCMTI